MADIREVVSYVSYGTLYAMLPEEYKIAFKKVPLNSTEDHFSLHSNLREKISVGKVRQEIEYAAVTQNSNSNSDKRYSSHASTSQATGRGNSNNQSQRGNFRGRSNRGGYGRNYTPSQDQGNNGQYQNRGEYNNF